MKFSGNPKRLIIQATALIITVMFITDMLVWFVYPGMNPVIFIIQAAIGIPLVFWILTQVIDKFIYQKIKVIYKNIHRLKRGKQPISDMIDKPDVFESVNRDVMEWAEKQEQEIPEHYLEPVFPHPLHIQKIPVQISVLNVRNPPTL
jgi:hypothetical protein